MNRSFTFAPAPLLHFGDGKISLLPSAIKTYGSKFILVTGATSFISSPNFDRLRDQIESAKLSFLHCRVDGEPTPAMIDAAVDEAKSFAPAVVIAIGGGSAMDAGKAISAMIPLNESVVNYLEGIGSKATHPGRKVPFIAIPTTAGTGSEAARNAVLSEIGRNGFKRSLRHNNFVPNIAILDPALALSCPSATTAASGMDAFTQLLESYLSPAGNALTDAMALEGLRLISTSLLPAYKDGSNMIARTGMTLAAYLSGVTLTNAGLGVIHGFASSIGGFFQIPHGIICSAMMGPVNKITVRRLRAEKSNTALKKYATAGQFFGNNGAKKSDDYYTDSLLSTIDSWKTEMKIPTLGAMGVSTMDFERIIQATDNKNNPIPLNTDELREALELASRN